MEEYFSFIMRIIWIAQAQCLFDALRASSLPNPLVTLPSPVRLPKIGNLPCCHEASGFEAISYSIIHHYPYLLSLITISIFIRHNLLFLVSSLVSNRL